MGNKVWSLRSLLVVTSIFEGATGLALIFKPSFVVSVLLGSSSIDLPGIIITRIAGSALFSLAVVCWFSRENKDANGLLIALLFYNLTSFVLLAHAGWYEGLIGMALWPAVATHLVMSVWCLWLLFWRKS